MAMSKGTRISLIYGDALTIIGDQPLGAGGQGEVYLVDYKGKNCALKWYTSKNLRESQIFKENLRNNISKGAPDESFIWPMDMTSDYNGSFGYVMELIPKDYEQLTYVLKTYKVKNKGKSTEKVSVRWKSFNAEIKAAVNIVSAFRNLHKIGKSYQDLNDGSLLFDLETGDVKICDCDNISDDFSSVSNIAGKFGYMAPEVVMRKEKPSVNTDKFSLAVILFKLFFMGHPLEGAKREDYDNGFSDKASYEMYGSKAVFVYDPKDESNRPIPGVDNNVIKLWDYYPQYFKNMFVRAFTDGMYDASKRPTEIEWLEILKKMYSETVFCKCGCPPQFISSQDTSKGYYTCPKCDEQYPIMDVTRGRSVISIALTPTTQMYSCQLRGDHDFDTVVGKVKENDKRPGLFGLKNLTENDTWITSKGTPIKPNQGYLIQSNLEIDFGNKCKGKIRELK